MTTLPAHLKRYIVAQDDSLYTPVDHAVWRYILRQLRAFLSVHAHPSYLTGLEKTGIAVERIPKISEISERLQAFGWRAVPVSGFIPPAAFMELQAYGYLPIASDMRTLGHLMYTPAPDIVHEAAGHAPILVDTEFATYLKRYAQVARKAIINKQDMDQYEAIRILSDVKEHPDSTPAQITNAEQHLDKVTRSIQNISEAARLGRMNWWTAEYGLVGTMKDPKIFGAGLLSSVSEARNCLRPEVKKIPLTLECVDYSYDITEQQPHLFVAPTFHHLGEVLEQLAETMAFRHGGVRGLEKAITAQTVNTVELDSGLQIGGRLVKWLATLDRVPARKANARGDTDKGTNNEEGIAYLQFQGPTQLAFHGHELTGHGHAYHAEGFGTPVGYLKMHPAKALSDFSPNELEQIGLRPEQRGRLEFMSGVIIEGKFRKHLYSEDRRLLVLTFDECTVRHGEEILFRPEWGAFDMGVGSSVTSVFGGPPDREAYGPLDDFVARKVPTKKYSAETFKKFEIYQEIRNIRESLQGNDDKLGENPTGASTPATRLQALVAKIEESYPSEWLLKLEVLEIGTQIQRPLAWKDRLQRELEQTTQTQPELATCIEDGLKLAGLSH